MKMIYNVEDKPAWSKLLVYAFQQVLAIMSATILVPAIIGLPTQMPAAILGAGIGTIVYLLFTRFKSPVCISSSFAFLSSLFVALTFGYCGIIVGGILAGLVYVVIAIIIFYLWILEVIVFHKRRCLPSHRLIGRHGGFTIQFTANASASQTENDK